MTSFWGELKRRNVIRVAIAYAIVSWLLLQMADVVLDNIEAPTWVFQAILLLLIIAFPVALIFAWAFELTPEGLKKEKDIDRSESITHITGRKLGEFKRSSQHLNEEDMRWPYVDNRREGVLFDHQCARPADRRYLVVSIDTDSGVRSHKAFRAKMLARLPVCRRQLVAGGSEKECPSSNKWNRSTFRLSECFAHHFQVTRHAVGSANYVSRWSSS